MELREYFHQRGRALLILLILPLVAAVASFVFLSKQPQQYDSTVQVAVPEAFANSDSRIGLYVADFGQVMTDTDLVDAVHKATKVSTDDLTSLAASRVNLSSRLQVELVSSAGARATSDAVVAAAKAARRKLATQGLDVQQAAVTQAQQAQDKAQQALTDYQNSIGLLFPDNTYQSTQATIRGLENSRVEAVAGNNPTRAAALDTQIKALQAQLTALTPQVRQAQVLGNAITTATTNLRTAQLELTDTQTLADTAGTDQGISAITSVPVSRVVPILEGVGVAVAVALVLGLAILLVPDLLRRPEHRRGIAVLTGTQPTDAEPLPAAAGALATPAVTDRREAGHGRHARERDGVDYATTTD